MPEKFLNKYRIPSARCPKWDYSSPGYYFVTVCTWEKLPIFGKIKHGQMKLSDIGKIVNEYWKQINNYYDFVALDEFIIMPDHLHGVILINPMDNNNFVETIPRDNFVETIHELSLQNNKKNNNQKSRRQMLIPKIIGKFKMQSAKQINIYRKKPGFSVWQKNYHDRIIRDENELIRIRQYIKDNPKNWKQDKKFRSDLWI